MRTRASRVDPCALLWEGAGTGGRRWGRAGIARALQKRCCSGESEAVASANSLAEGIVSRISGINSESLSFTMSAAVGLNSSAAAMVPIISTKEENWRARTSITNMFCISSSSTLW